MNGYPTAYRPGSSIYRGTTAFKGSPEARVGGGWSGAGPNWSGPLIDLPKQGPGLYGDRPPVMDKPRGGWGPAWEKPPSGPPLQTQSSPLAGVSAGAYAGALARSTPLGKAIQLAKVAYWLAENVSVDYGGNILIHPGWTECQSCGPGEKFYGEGNLPESIGTPCPAQPTFCFKGSGDPGGGPITSRSIYMVSLHVTPNGRYDLGTIWYRTSPFAPVPYLLNVAWWDWFRFAWSWLPELDPVQSPKGEASQNPIPFAHWGDREDSPYRETGPQPGNTSQWGLQQAARAALLMRQMPYPFPFPSMLRGGVPPTIPVKLTDKHDPPQGPKDRKFRMGTTALRIWMALGAFTELDEATECLWKSLPANKRQTIKGKKVAGKTEYYWNKYYVKSHGISAEAAAKHNDAFKNQGRAVHQTPQHMISDILASPGDLDARKFQDCFLANAVIDAGIGIANQQTRRNLQDFQRKTGQSVTWLHIGSGPAL